MKFLQGPIGLHPLLLVEMDTVNFIPVSDDPEREILPPSANSKLYATNIAVYGDLEDCDDNIKNYLTWMDSDSLR
jgi:hypothetical protein